MLIDYLETERISSWIAKYFGKQSTKHTEKLYLAKLPRKNKTAQD